MSDAIVPTYSMLVMWSPYGVYPYPSHFLLPDDKTAMLLGKRYGFQPVQVLDPRLQFKQGLWSLAPNFAWWLALPNGLGIDCSVLAQFWTLMGADHPETAELYCTNAIADYQRHGQKLPPPYVPGV